MNNKLKMLKKGRPKTLNLDELIDVAMVTYRAVSDEYARAHA